jgi:hypothetical protein
MTRDETLTLLRTRSALTSQPYSDDVAEAWHDALHEWSLTEARNALVQAARDEKRITVAHLVERLPSRTPPQRRTGPLYDPADGPIMGRDEYLALLERRAHRGDTDAAVERDRWHRIINRAGESPNERITQPEQETLDVSF